MFIILTIIISGLIIGLIIIYNRFIHLKNQVDAAWSDISIQLKRRHDLIPKLVDVVKQYAAYEKTVLERITVLRSQSQRIDDQKDLAVTGQLENQLSEQFMQIKLLSESYPDLKASEHFTRLQQDLSLIEDSLQHARRYYNGAVRLLNTQIDQFPDLLIARIFNFTPRQFFQMDMN